MQGSHIFWKTLKNESTLGKIVEFCKEKKIMGKLCETWNIILLKVKSG